MPPAQMDIRRSLRSQVARIYRRPPILPAAQYLDLRSLSRPQQSAPIRLHLAPQPFRRRLANEGAFSAEAFDKPVRLDLVERLADRRPRDAILRRELIDRRDPSPRSPNPGVNTAPEQRR